MTRCTDRLSTRIPSGVPVVTGSVVGVEMAAGARAPPSRKRQLRSPTHRLANDWAAARWRRRSTSDIQEDSPAEMTTPALAFRRCGRSRPARAHEYLSLRHCTVRTHVTLRGTVKLLKTTCLLPPLTVVCTCRPASRKRAPSPLLRGAPSPLLEAPSRKGLVVIRVYAC